jgi:hypothetical protein
VVADLSTTQATEKFFRPIRASTVLRIGFLMVDPLNFKTLMKVVPSSAFVGIRAL